jgi:hypothetical protein
MWQAGRTTSDRRLRGATPILILRGGGASPHDLLIYDLAAKPVDDLGYPPGWLNDAVKAYVPQGSLRLSDR